MQDNYELDLSKETFTGSEIIAELYRQNRGDPNVTLDISDLNKPVKRNCQISITCGRCGRSTNMSPISLLTSFENRGYICPRCGNIEDEELREIQKQEMLEKGTESLKEAYGEEEFDKLVNERNRKNKIREEEKIYTEGEENENDSGKERGRSAKEVHEGRDKISENREINNAVTSESLSKYDEREENRERIESNNEESERRESGNNQKQMNDKNDLETLSIGEIIKSKNDKKEKSVENSIKSLSEEIIDKFDGIEEDLESLNIEDELNSIIDSEEMEEKSVEEDVSEPMYDLGDNTFISFQQLTDSINYYLDKVHKEINYNPYDYDIEYTENSIILKCKLCGEKVIIRRPQEMYEKILYYTPEEAAKLGTSFIKPAVFHYCPNCLKDFIKNGKNTIFERKVISYLDKKGFEINSSERYYFMSMTEKFSIFFKRTKDKFKFNYLGFGNLDSMASKINARLKEENENKTIKSEGGGTLNDRGFMYSKDENTIKREKAEESSRIYESTMKESKFKTGFKFTNRDDRSEYADITNGPNPFTQKKTYKELYERSIFKDFISELANEAKVAYKVVINERTFEIPFIDFESGLRLICIDLNEDSLLNADPNQLGSAKRCPFSYNVSNWTYAMLYSDSVKFSRGATIGALVKKINPSVLPYKGKKIELGSSENIMLRYTTNNIHMDEFSQRCSTYPNGKPRNGQLGILVNFVKSNTKYNTQDVIRLQNYITNPSDKMDIDNLADLGCYVACGIKYIEIFNEEINRVVYTITEYIEVDSAIIADGFYQCIRGLMKEYMTKFPNLSTKAPYIIYEYDPNTFVSPSIMGYIDKKSLIPLNSDNITKELIFTTNQMNNQWQYLYGQQTPQYLRYQYVRKNAYRSEKTRDEQRQDMRFFTGKSIKTRYAAELRDSHMYNNIHMENERIAWIKNMGFVKSKQPDTVEYMLNSNIVQSVLFDGNTYIFNKFQDISQAPSYSGLVANSDDKSKSVNAFNPLVAQRMFDIMNNSNKETKEFLGSVTGMYMAENPTNEQAMMYGNMMGMNPYVARAMQEMMNANGNYQGAYMYSPNMPGMNN